MLFCCSLPKFGKVPKGQINILHPKMSQIARKFSNFLRNFCHKFSATFGFFECNFLGGLNSETDSATAAAAAATTTTTTTTCTVATTTYYSVVVTLAPTTFSSVYHYYCILLTP